MPINFDYHKVELNWGGQPLTLETGKIARQADGAVLATLGETVLLATVVSAKTAKPGQDFFPLTVNYQEKYFAAGKIPGGYFKREGRPTENETLTSRASSTVRSARCSPMATRTRPRSSSPFSSTTWRTIPTSSPWSPPLPR